MARTYTRKVDLKQFERARRQAVPELGNRLTILAKENPSEIGMYCSLIQTLERMAICKKSSSNPNKKVDPIFLQYVDLMDKKLSHDEAREELGVSRHEARSFASSYAYGKACYALRIARKRSK